MTDFEFLVVALVCVYLSECLFWVRRGSMVFRKWWGGFGAAHPSPGLGTRQTGLVVVNPLPPFGTAFLAHQWPIAFVPEGICAAVAEVINGWERPEQTGAYVAFEDLYKVGRDGDALLINGKRFATCNGEALASRMEQVIRAVLRTTPADRSGAIAAALGRSVDLARIRRQIRRYRLLAGSLRWNAHLLFLVIFGAIPATVGMESLRRFLVPALVLLLGFLVIQCVGFFWAHRRLYPGAAGARWRATLTMLFTPTASIRACDPLGKELLAGFQPLAIAMVVCGDAQRQAVARRMLLDCLYPMQPMCVTEDPRARAAVAGFHGQLTLALLETVREAGYDPAELLGPPPVQDASCKSYCPRCDSQYVLETGTCHHCGEIPLCAFGSGDAVVLPA